MPQFLILSGTFREPDDTVKGPGDTIELGEDIARLHAGKLQPVDAQPVAAEPAADA